MSVVRGFYWAIHSNRCEPWSPSISRVSYRNWLQQTYMWGSWSHTREQKLGKAWGNLSWDWWILWAIVGKVNRGSVCCMHGILTPPGKWSCNIHVLLAKLGLKPPSHHAPYPFISASSFNLDCLLAVNHLGSITTLWPCRFLGCCWLHWALLGLSFLWLASSFTVAGC